MVHISKGHRSQLENIPNGQRWKNLSKKNEVVLNCDPKYNINVHESMLIK